MVTRKKSTKRAEPKAKVVKKKTVKDFAKKVAEKLSPTHEAVEASTPDEITNGSDVVVTVTDAAEPVELVEHEPVLSSPDEMMYLAWHNVKDASDPEFEHCAGTFQNDLRYHAEGIFKGNVPLEGDSVLARFEQELALIRKGK